MSMFHNPDNTSPHPTSTGTRPVTTVVIRIDDHNLEATVTMVTPADLAVVTEDLDMVVIPNSLLMQHCCHPFNTVKNVI